MDKKYLLFGLLVFIILIDGCGTNNTNDYYAQPKSTSSGLSVGSEGRVYVEGSSEVILAKTKSALDEMTKASTAGDIVGYKAPYLRGEAFFVNSNTKVLVLENTFASVKVRVLEGLHKNDVGWVPYEWVR